MAIPLVTSQIDDMDRSRMTFIGDILDHINKLREELRINEIILHSVVQSLSAPTDAMSQLDVNLHEQRKESANHRPMILTKEEQQRVERMQQALLGEVGKLNGVNSEG